MTAIPIEAALADPALFGAALPGESWQRRRVLLKATFGAPLDADELAIYQHHTGRTDEPQGAFREVVEISGRRGGKTRAAALIACYVATCIDLAPYLSAGEVPTVALIATDRKQARTLKRYIEGFLRAEMLGGLIDGEPTADAIQLTTGVRIEIMTASLASTRGYTYVAVIADEIAFWRGSDESSNPAAEILRAIRPGLATIPVSVLIIISTPYAKEGPLYSLYRKHFGVNGSRVLVWRGTTEEMNPTVDPEFIREAREEDPEAAASEYDALFRDDLSTFVSADVVFECTIPGRTALPRTDGVVYAGFSDPGGGSGKDSFASAIAHRDAAGKLVLDALKETRPPFNTDEVTAAHSEFFKAFGVRVVQGDHYAGFWPRDRFAAHGIDYQRNARPKSELFLEFVPLLNSRKVELLDEKKMLGQLTALQRRTSRSGKDSVEHPPNAHDDAINAAVGALLRAHAHDAQQAIIAKPMIVTAGGHFAGVFGYGNGYQGVF